MGAPIRFYFDFASPYAWFALDAIEKVAEDYSREIEWRPVLVWAILKALGVPSPMEVPQRRRYFLADMARSAAFHKVPYREPAKLPVSSHFAARMYYWLADRNDPRARLFGRDVFTAFLVDRQDITDPETLLSLAAGRGVSREDAREAMNGPLGRDRLSNAVDKAVKAGVVGSPFFIVDGEGFFGADRVAQIAWRLASQQPAARAPDRMDLRS